MYIEIASDIIRDALAKSPNEPNESLDILTLFALSAQKGKHIVYVPCLHNNQSIVIKLEKLMGRPHLSLLRRSESMYYQLLAIKKAVTVYAIITYDHSIKKEKAITINPLEEKVFEPYNETRVICENIQDAKFFRYIIKFFLRQETLLGCQTLFVPIMGGGDSTAEVLRDEVERKQFFCLVITDSDRKYPYAEYGQTVKKVQSVIDDYHPFNCSLYVMDQVMEVENLIPYTVIKSFFSSNGFVEIFSKDASFYDMKNGLTLNWLFDENVCDYWRNMLYDLDLDLSERDDARQHCKNRKEYQDYIDKKGYKKCLKKGFGCDLLKRCTSNLDSKDDRIKPHIIDALFNVSFKDLTTYQQNEWLRIGRELFSWTCCISSKRIG